MLVCIQQTNEIVRVQAIIQVILSTPSDCVDHTQLQFTVMTALDTDSLTNYTKLNIQVQLHNQFSPSQVPEFLGDHLSSSSLKNDHFVSSLQKPPYRQK